MTITLLFGRGRTIENGRVKTLQRVWEISGPVVFTQALSMEVFGQCQCRYRRRSFVEFSLEMAVNVSGWIPSEFAM